MRLPASLRQCIRRTTISRLCIALAFQILWQVGNCSQFKVVGLLIAVRLRADACTGWFVLDSGSYQSTITSKAASRFGPSTNFSGIDERNRPFIIINKLHLGSSQLEKVKLIQTEPLPNSLVVPGTNEMVMGTIGYDQLRHLSLLADFQKRDITITSGGSSESSIFSQCPQLLAELHEDGGIPSTHMEINGIKTAVVIDTGAFLNTLNAETASLAAVKPFANQVPTFVGGSVHSLQLTVSKKVQLATTIWSSLPFLIYGKGIDLPNGLGWTSLVPFRKVLFDFRHSRLKIPKVAKPVGLKTTLLSLYDCELGSSDLIVRSAYRIPLREIRSFFGRKVKDGSALLRDEFWRVTPSSEEMLWRMLYPPMSELTIFRDGISQHLKPTFFDTSYRIVEAANYNMKYSATTSTMLLSCTCSRVQRPNAPD